MNRATYLDKLHACWLGKNIGGTIGAPFEGRKTLLNIQGFTTPEGEPLPNDDLDLQLVWLVALEEVGVERFNTNVLAEFWLDWIPPHWNEYGVAKTNLSLGLLPPLSGEMDNEKWKTSNGAWIRSEIWAGLAPGYVDVAVKYAMMDAMVDHGLSEGTIAEVFTVTLQSAAYVESDIRKLLDIALAKIPTESLTAKTVNLVIECFDKGLSFEQAREKVVELNAELGFFQAPMNLGFVTIGLLYGQGDFKKSILYAVNCGDDTDCTAGTVGATLGIIGGTKGIPEDWKSFVGDKIITVSINGQYSSRIPKTCTALADRIYKLVPDIFKNEYIPFEFTDDQTTTEKLADEYNKLTYKQLFNRSPYSYDVTHYRAFTARVEFDELPRVSTGDTRKVTLTFMCNYRLMQPRKLNMRLILPESWQVDKYDKTVMLPYRQWLHGIDGDVKTSFNLVVGEKVEPVNRAYVELTCSTMAYPVIVPIILLG